MKLYEPNFYSRQVLKIKPLRAARIAALASTWLLSTLAIVTTGAPAPRAITSNVTNSTVRYALEGTEMSPSLAATPGDASFGNVPEGTTNTQTIQLKNTGSRNVTVTGTSLSVTGYHVSGLTLPLTLAAGADGFIF